jgi:hypothetical protein
VGVKFVNVYKSVALLADVYTKSVLLSNVTSSIAPQVVPELAVQLAIDPVPSGFKDSTFASPRKVLYGAGPVVSTI